MSFAFSKEPAQIIATVIGLLGAIVTFCTTVLNDVGPDAGWAQVGLVALAAGVPIVQGWITRGHVFAPASVREAEIRA